MGAFQAWRLETGASYDLRMIAHQCRQDLQKQRPVSAQAEMSASEASVYTSAPTSLSASAKAELIFGSEDTPENTIIYGMTKRALHAPPGGPEERKAWPADGFFFFPPLVGAVAGVAGVAGVCVAGGRAGVGLAWRASRCLLPPPVA